MKRISLLYPVISLLFAFTLSGISISCKTPAFQPEVNTPENESIPIEQIEPAETVPKKPAAFEVGALNIPDICMTGTTIPVKTIVSNVGDEPGIFAAIFTVNGEEVDRDLISIGEGDSEEIVFEYIGQEIGECEFCVGESCNAVTIHGWDTCRIKYEQGIFKFSSNYYVEGDNGHAVLFKPEAEIFKIQKVRIGGMVAEGNRNEPKDRQFTVNIWDKSLDSMLWSEDFPWQLFSDSMEWIEIEVPDICVDDDFIVEFISHSEPSVGPSNRLIYTCIALGWEKNSSDECHSALIVDGVIYSAPDHNWFIRVEGKCSRLD